MKYTQTILKVWLTVSGIEFEAQTYLGATTVLNNTVALRDSTGKVTANTFDGVATSALC